MFRNVDYAILGARLSALHTGWYYRAFNLGVVYQDKLSRIMMQLAFPVYSRTRDHAELRRMHERAARVHAVVIFPLLTSLIVLAPLLIPLVFGPAWTGAILPTEILAVAGMCAAVLTGYPQVMLAVGKPRPLLYFNLGVLATYATGIFLASGHGLVVVAVTVVILYSLILLGAYRLLLQRYVGITVRRLIPELGPAVAGCLALAAITEPLRRVAESALPRVVVIGGVGAIGLIVYAVVLRLAFPAAWTDVRLLAVRVAPQLPRLYERLLARTEHLGSRTRRRGSRPEAPALVRHSPEAASSD
jgi:PST family polysaccharide transporter